jgi:hypothetical protein
MYHVKEKTNLALWVLGSTPVSCPLGFDTQVPLVCLPSYLAGLAVGVSSLCLSICLSVCPTVSFLLLGFYICNSVCVYFVSVQYIYPPVLWLIRSSYQSSSIPAFLEFYVTACYFFCAPVYLTIHLSVSPARQLVCQSTFCQPTVWQSTVCQSTVCQSTVCQSTICQSTI